jgi:hypothetical protein
MGCPCQQKKPSAAAAAPATTIKVRLINHSPTPAQLVGQSTKRSYGSFKNGDRILIRVEDYESEPEKFVKL